MELIVSKRIGIVKFFLAFFGQPQLKSVTKTVG